MRYLQWLLDVQKVDGFRIDAAKHMASWTFDSFFDTVSYNRRETPDGRFVIPYSFVESVESNDFTFDRFVRKPNGRTTGRTGDSFGNRDALDLSGAGRIRDLITNYGAGVGTGNGTWVGSYSVLAAHIDSTDDGFNNGTVGVNHIWSHDNGSTGNGSSAPTTPTSVQQGWFAHAYLTMRPGQAKLFHNARGINRSSGFWPRAGLTPPFGVEPSNNTTNRVISTLVQSANHLGRGEFYPRIQEGDVYIFERASRLPNNSLSGNVIVGANDTYRAGYDQRTFTTNFPQGTRLVEVTGNATDPLVDPNNDIFDVVTVGAGGSVTIRVPTNTNPNNVQHHRGWVIYAPAIPAGTLSIVGSTTSLPAEGTTVVSWRRRTNAIPIVTGNTFDLQLVTTKGDTGAPNNDTADDNAVFRINKGFFDYNSNGNIDIDYTNGVVPGFEFFTQVNQPLYGTTNTTGLYRQTIDCNDLFEGYNYITVTAFAKRPNDYAPLFREFRTAVYVDRLDPTFTLTNPDNLPEGTTSNKFFVKALDKTVTKVHIILNPADLSDPISLATTSNVATQDDRYDWSRTLLNMRDDENTIVVVAFEESGRAAYQIYTVNIGTPCDSLDFNQDQVFPDLQDALDFIAVYGGGNCPTAQCNDIDFNNDEVFPDGQDLIDFFAVFGGAPCPN
jgi:hypothetical protein